MHTFFRTVPDIAHLFSNKNIFQYVWLLISLWAVLILSGVIKIQIPITITFVYKGISCQLRIKNKSDIAVLKETFLLEEYKWDAVKNPNIIIDLGAHIGDTALYYHCTYPTARIFAVEPDPILFERLCENVRGIKEIVPIHAAISDTIGLVRLNILSKSSLSGSLMKRKDNADFTIDVPGLTLSELFKLQNITKVDLLKFDIEGAEKYLFSEHKASKYADAYIGELHCDLMEISSEVFLEAFSDYSVELLPMDRNNRFTLKAFKKE